MAGEGMEACEPRVCRDLAKVNGIVYEEEEVQNGRGVRNTWGEGGWRLI